MFALTWTMTADGPKRYKESLKDSNLVSTQWSVMSFFSNTQTCTLLSYLWKIGMMKIWSMAVNPELMWYALLTMRGGSWPREAPMPR